MSSWPLLCYRIRLLSSKQKQSKQKLPNTWSFSESSHAVINSGLSHLYLLLNIGDFKQALPLWSLVNVSRSQGSIHLHPRPYFRGSISRGSPEIFFFSYWVGLPTVHSLRHHCVQENEIPVQATHSPVWKWEQLGEKEGDMEPAEITSKSNCLLIGRTLKTRSLSSLP